jgi:hypothetical protein
MPSWGEGICCSLNYDTRAILRRNYVCALVVIRYCMYLMPIVLCISGTLSRGTLCMYPLGRVPTHPFRVLGRVAHGNTKGGFSSCWY